MSTWALVLMCLHVGCQQQATATVAITTVRGKAMGTSYTLKYIPLDPVQSVKQQVDAELARFDQVFSLYDPKSEISRFNQHRSTDPFDAGPEFAAVVRRALDLAKRTGGAFDPTIGPLLRLYGHGPDGETPNALPAPEAIAAAREDTGWSKLQVSEDGKLTKQVPALELDLNGIAKGTGVDVVAKLLDDLGITSYMIEIGGEVRCRGRKPDGAVWRLGVAQPGKDPTALAEKVDLLDQAMATSGSYLQYRDIGGGRVHHILDRRTGANAKNRVVSVTVIASTCELADALATALMVLGPTEGEKVLASFVEDDVKVLYLLSAGNKIQRHMYRW